MKRNPILAAAALLAITVAAIFLYPLLLATGPVARQAIPPDPNAQPAGIDGQVASANQSERVEAAFVIDSTGSMGSMIRVAKDKVWSIASTLASGNPSPEIRIGLVAYRDRGDAYVVRVYDLTKDIDAIHIALMQLDAEGGGDGPESVNAAPHAAVNQLSWSQDQDVYRTVMLVGDAPPHMDYQHEAAWPRIVQAVNALGIKVNAIQCGDDPKTRSYWQQISQSGEGRYFRVDQEGGAVEIATPFYRRMRMLSEELDETCCGLDRIAPCGTCKKCDFQGICRSAPTTA